MTTSDLNGSGVDNVNGFFTDDGICRSAFNGPTGRVAANGNRPVLITAIRMYVNGYASSISVKMFVANSDGGAAVYTGSFTCGNGSSASLSATRNLAGAGKLITNSNAPALRCGTDTSNGAYFGRNADSGNTIVGPFSTLYSNHGLAGTYNWAQVPTAPPSPAVISSGATSATVTWGTPSDDGDSAITGYKVQWSTSATFASGVTTITLGNVHSTIIGNLPTNTVIYFRVMALNAVATSASTSSPYSTTVNIMLVSGAGNLDGWVKLGTLPAGVSAFTTENLRRANATVTGSPSSISRESTITTAPVTLATDTYGAKRTVTGLTIGKTYQLAAKAAYVGTVIDANTPNRYQLGIVGMTYGTDVTLAVVNQIYDMPTYEFVATATSHEIAYRLHEAVTRPAVGELERVAVFNISLAEMPLLVSPFVLNDINYESSLVNHFDVACQSVGARWWVDAFGVTQFAATLADPSYLATFTDVRTPGALEYIDVDRKFDTRTIVNDLNLIQHSLLDDDNFNYKNLTSSATWGPRSDDLDISLYDTAPYAGSVAALAAAILAAHADAVIEIAGIVWNAQEDPDIASQLDVYGLVDIKRGALDQPSRIISVEHRITPSRWIVSLEVIKKV